MTPFIPYPARIVVFFIATFLFFFTGNAQNFSVMPLTLDFNLRPGESGTQTLEILNNAPKAQTFKLYIGDWERDSIGTHDYKEAGTLDRSCSSWLSFTPSFIELGPGEKTNVSVSLSAPEDPANFNEMKWCMLFIENTEEQTAPVINEGAVSVGMKMVFQYGIHIYQTPPQLTRAAMSVEDLVVNKDDLVLDLTVKNVGDVQIVRCEAFLEITHLTTGEEYRVKSTFFPVFPDAVRRIQFKLPEDLPKGKYALLGALDIGASQPLEAVEAVMEIE